MKKKNQCIICVCYGEVKFKLIDGRKKSKSFNKENNITLSKINHTILIIPPGIWFSFTTNKKKSIFANLIDRIHTDKESSKANKVKNYEIK